tara:strand:+ start:102 stop:1070 length:969 start_codon:yes stop_codon:yes gene_type:complete
MRLSLAIKPFSFKLLKPLHTSQGILNQRQGWLLKVEDSYGNCGWGEISPLNPAELTICEKSLHKLKLSPLRAELEEKLTSEAGALGFGFGAALAELDCLIGQKSKRGWLKPPKSAILLPNGNSLLTVLNCYLNKSKKVQKPITLKWKVGVDDSSLEKNLLKKILEILPVSYHLRIDANAGWSRNEAEDWANQLAGDARLDWLEQPLAVNDFEGLLKLSEKVPIALDESLIHNPSLRNSWKSWQVRRPILEGDPRQLLQDVKNGKSHIAISTSFETGIGRRWVNHLAALQQESSTPTAPGLAPGWRPKGALFSNNPQKVWEAA